MIDQNQDNRSSSNPRYTSPKPIREQHSDHVTQTRISAPGPEVTGKWSGTPREIFGTPRNIFGKSSEHLRKSSGTPREPIGKSSEPLGSSSDHLRKPLRNRRFPPEIIGNPSEPVRVPSRKVVDKFGEEKGKVTTEARTRNLWRAKPTLTPLDHNASHSARHANLTTYTTGSKPHKN